MTFRHQALSEPLTPEAAVLVVHLVVERAEVVEPAKPEQATREQPQDTRADLTDIHPVHSEHAEKRLKEPRHGVIISSRGIAAVRIRIHARDEKHIDDPADAQQASGQQPDHARHRPPVIKPVRAGETKQPEKVADQFVVGDHTLRVHAGHYIIQSRDREGIPWGLPQQIPCGFPPRFIFPWRFPPML